MARQPKRLLPEIPLPPYSYVTGRFAHPTRHPAGHSFGHTPETPPRIDPAGWTKSPDYLLACDLFNYGYYWEAHEAWEGLWHACGRVGTTADFLKGLIKLAAAGVKSREGRADGVRRHAGRATELFQRVRDQIEGPNFLGLDIERLIETARQIEQDPPTPNTSGQPVDLVFDFFLLPEQKDSRRT